jgi:hypothetical protein
MFINCPYCKALVSTDPVTDLPPVRCPHCDSMLRRDPGAVDEDETQPLDVAALLRAPYQTAPPTDAPSPEAADAVIVPSDGRADDATPAGPLPVVASVPEPARPRRTRGMPSFAHGQARAAAPRERWLPIAVGALGVLLALQLLLADRARLAGDAHWRPLLEAVCGALRCDLPPWREPGAFTLVQRDVRQHPSLPGVLRVTATFRNDARWAQPWPRLRLTLTDGNGRPAGERSFDAREYLGGAPSQPLLAGGESAAVAMDILEPASDIVGYDFTFR